MTPEERLFQDAQTAFNQDDLSLARDLLTRLLKLNRKNPDYWLWMSVVVKTNKERGFCLREVLKLDPENLTAIQGLRLMGENVPLPGNPVRLLDLRREWKTSLDVEQPKPPSMLKKNLKLLGYSLAGSLLVGVIILVAIISLKPRYRPNTSPIMRFSLTPPVTVTPASKPTDIIEGLPPLSSLLKSTFTPTPLVVRTPHNRTEAYQAAMRAYEKGDWGRALEYFNQVLEVEPGAVDMQYYIGEIYRQQGVLNKALDSFNACIKMDPSFAPAYLGRARSLFQVEKTKPEEIEANLQKALELDPLLSEAMLEFTRFYLDQKKPESAQLWLDKLEVLISQTGQMELIQSQILMQQDKHEQALTSIQKSMRLDPTNLETYRLLGEILQKNLRYEESIEPLITYETYAANDPGVMLLLARAYFETEDVENAMVYAERVLTVKPNSVQGYVIRAQVNLLQAKVEEAERDFDNALRLDKDSFEANLGKGRILYDQGYPGLAYEYIDTAFDNTDTDRQTALALAWRGLALVELDQVSAAIRDFEALFAQPKSMIPQDLLEDVRTAYETIVTPTPSSTATRTATPTSTPSITPTPTPN